MNIKIKRFDKELPLPEYKSKGAVALDLYAREDTTIQPGEVRLIPLNIAIEIPKGYFVLIANRSSTYKLGITCVNGIGVGDHDYCGDNDEYMFPALNYTDKEVYIERGTRCCQMLILPVANVDIQEVEKMKNPDRGGFGTTGKKS
jgi:dUTP pyrophosphatase